MLSIKNKLPSLLCVHPGLSTHKKSWGGAVSLGEVQEQCERLEELEGGTGGWRTPGRDSWASGTLLGLGGGLGHS